jgi:hypothetical protein
VKLVQIHYHFEFSEDIEAILETHEVAHFVRYPMIEGRDREGRHYGSKVYPGSSSVVQALVEDERVDGLLEDLEDYRKAEASHEHVTAVVMPVERTVGG